MKKLLNPFFLLSVIINMLACSEADHSENKNNELGIDGIPNESKFIADFSVAKERILRSIPEEFINKARNELHIAYQHTSHGAQVSRGLFGLQDYKQNDEILFGIACNDPQENKLDYRDYAIQEYAAEGQKALDLSANETAFIQATRNYLDDPENSEINVVMWSWCNIKNHDVEINYLPGMLMLINEYGKEGTKIGNAMGQKKNPVTFIIMTGHANENDNVGDSKPKNQAELITDFCEQENQFCLDYYSIDTHCMNDKYWEDAGDDGNSKSYGGNFYLDWQNSHELSVDFFENKKMPGGKVAYGNHNTQHITANRKAYAMWWILARIAGWDGEYSN